MFQGGGAVAGGGPGEPGVVAVLLLEWGLFRTYMLHFARADPSHPAHQHRTVVTTRERVLVVKEDERRRGVELAERVQMAASSHRSNASAIQAATKQQATKTRHA